MTNDQAQTRLDTLVILITKYKHLYSTSDRLYSWMREYDLIKDQYPTVFTAHCSNNELSPFHTANDILA